MKMSNMKKDLGSLIGKATVSVAKIEAMQHVHTSPISPRNRTH